MVYIPGRGSGNGGGDHDDSYIPNRCHSIDLKQEISYSASEIINLIESAENKVIRKGRHSKI